MTPIRAERQGLYPAEWPAISREVRERAGHRCERCGVRNYAVGYRDEAGTFVHLAGSGACDAAGQGLGLNNGPTTYAEALQIASTLNGSIRLAPSAPPPFDLDANGHHWIVVVLTVAHLNHDESDCRLENLEALCQQCHNRLDAARRRAGIVTRQRESSGETSGDLFDRLADYGGGSD